MDRGAHLGTALLVALLGGGCVTTDPYPDAWPPRVSGDAECPDLSGVYENTGHGSGGVLFCPECGKTNDYRECAELCSDRDVQLSEVFFGRMLAVEGPVGITWPGARSMEIRLETPDAPPEHRLLSSDGGDFECAEGQLWLLLDRDLEVDLGGVAVSSKRLGLANAEDGSLIGEFHYTGSGVIFVAVPAGWSETHFIRWTRDEPGEPETRE